METALITGASTGIGKELARIFAQKGINLVLVARSQEKLQGLKSELEKDFGINAHAIPIDLSVPQSALRVFEETNSRNLQIDYLINNAGVGVYGEFYATDWEKELTMINLNITSLTQLTKLFLEGMKQRGTGRIMNVASVAAFQPGPLMSVYFATKAYVLHFSEAIGYELRKSRITVTTLCPGPTRSGFENAASMKASKLFKQKGIPSSAEVARFGYNAMMKGKSVAIHGWKNSLLARSTGFVPRKLVLAIAEKIQGRE
ncbi:SDR family NAD(P)-dependent oxidoreductase [Pleomorphovibrio marinus]|uniref:SDR family NAD(P)-dependent oxidoreductase n=1 Tax=Pleomorphovibrio marinus TaxID=2164132 RepID=UPI000E0A7E52|nr:SDR family oxidoreductase [Pleomorphovibrio marinus]